MHGFCLCQGWCLSDWENDGKMLPNLQTFGFWSFLQKYLEGVGAKHQINHTNHNTQQRQSKQNTQGLTGKPTQYTMPKKIQEKQIMQNYLNYHKIGKKNKNTMVNWPESQKPRFLQGFCLCQGWCLSDWENDGKMLPNLQTFGFWSFLQKYLEGVGAKHQINHTNHKTQQRQSKQNTQGLTGKPIQYIMPKKIQEKNK